MSEQKSAAAQLEDLAENEAWNYAFAAAYDIIPLDKPTDESNHVIQEMKVKVSSANQEYINRLFRMKRSEYSNEVVFKSDGNQDNPVRNLVRTVATGEPDARQAAARQLAAQLAAATPRQVPRGLLVILVGKFANHERVCLWRFSNQNTLSMVEEDGEFIFAVTKTFTGEETTEYKAAMFEGTSSKTSMWKGRVKDFQSANRSLDVAKYWMDLLQCELQLRPDYATRRACEAFRFTADKATSPEQREQVEAALIVLKAQDKAMKTMNQLAETLPEERRADFIKALKLPADQLGLQFAINASQVDAAYKYRVLKFEDGSTLKGKRESFDDQNITIEHGPPDGRDRVTILGKIVRDHPQAQ